MEPEFQRDQRLLLPFGRASYTVIPNIDVAKDFKFRLPQIFLSMRNYT
jgi:hypothetical protein